LLRQENSRHFAENAEVKLQNEPSHSHGKSLEDRETDEFLNLENKENKE
ncbi:9703_t:CDS:2, partial [Diversispora eburnea]